MGTCVSVKLSIRGSADDAKATKVIADKSCSVLSLTLPKNRLLCPKIGGLRSQWNSAQMNNWHPWQLKKIKILRAGLMLPGRQYANPAHLPKKWAKLAVLFSW